MAEMTADEVNAEQKKRAECVSSINSLLPRAAEDNPVLLTTLQEITDELGRLGTAVYDPPIIIDRIDSGTSDKPRAPIAFHYQLNPLNVTLTWTPATFEYTLYEIRKGASWDVAVKVLATNTNLAILDPLLYGSHRYWIKAVSIDGQYSTDALYVDIFIPIIGPISILPLVASNAVTLSWTVPTSTFKIEFYEIKRDGVKVATTAGTFFAISEELAGTHVYGITAVDVAGNRSAESTASVVTTGITDYIFFARLISSLNGTIVNGKKQSEGIYYNVNRTETYQQHFTSRSWTTPQAQIDAGYPAWASPFLTTGSYEEVFDFGAIIHAVIVSVNWNYQLVYGSVVFGFEIQTSSDGITYGPIQSSPSFFATEVRYVKTKLKFNSDDKSLVLLKELAVSLNVKRENDGGFGTAIASDPLGTAVTFIKPFVDVESITVTPVSNTATFSTYEFNDIPFPTSFAVKIYDNAGVRITRDFRWAARGIV